MKKLVLLGSTGSIGTQTLDIVRERPEELSVLALSAGKNAKLLEAQIREFHPAYAVLSDADAAKDLAERVRDLEVKILSGMEGLIEIASLPDADVVETAIVGMIGIRPTIAAIDAGHDIALANKETLVTAGHLIIPMAKEKGVRILPVDSEHSAIFQSLNGEKTDSIAKIWLTCSGGPFRGYTREQLEKVTLADALKHPNWAMGKKITVDSATMVNKGLEVMEAKWLFGVDYDDINVLVHPQSIIHSMVEYRDGAVIAQLGLPDMKLPIRYALFYPERKPVAGEKADFYRIGHLDFEKPDPETFEGLALALTAARTGGTMPTVFNAANEQAVALFLQERIGFTDIPRLIGECMAKHRTVDAPGVDEILAAQEEAVRRVGELA